MRAAVEQKGDKASISCQLFDIDRRPMTEQQRNEFQWIGAVLLPDCLNSRASSLLSPSVHLMFSSVVDRRGSLRHSIVQSLVDSYLIVCTAAVAVAPTMDILTQMHNYIGYLAGYMASTLDHINQHAPPIMPPSLTQHTTSSSTPPSSSSHSSPSTPPAPQLDPAFSSSLDDRGHQLYKRLSELRTLAECLPADVSTEEEQLQVLAELNAASEVEQRRLEAAEAEARLWQARLSLALQEAAAAQLAIITQTGGTGSRNSVHQHKATKKGNRRPNKRTTDSAVYDMSSSSPLPASSPYANGSMNE